jgi:acyl-CoA synthetase (AMP-forming)/AMP-acid ligase II
VASCGSDTSIVSWLPFCHDMGLVVGVAFPVLSGLCAVLTRPVAFLERPAPVDTFDGEQHCRDLGATELRFRFDRTKNILSAASGSNP